MVVGGKEWHALRQGRCPEAETDDFWKKRECNIHASKDRR